MGSLTGSLIHFGNAGLGTGGTDIDAIGFKADQLFFTNNPGGDPVVGVNDGSMSAGHGSSAVGTVAECYGAGGIATGDNAKALFGAQVLADRAIGIGQTLHSVPYEISSVSTLPNSSGIDRENAQNSSVILVNKRIDSNGVYLLSVSRNNVFLPSEGLDVSGNLSSPKDMRFYRGLISIRERTSTIHALYTCLVATYNGAIIFNSFKLENSTLVGGMTVSFAFIIINTNQMVLEATISNHSFFNPYAATCSLVGHRGSSPFLTV